MINSTSRNGLKKEEISKLTVITCEEENKSEENVCSVCCTAAAVGDKLY